MKTMNRQIKFTTRINQYLVLNILLLTGLTMFGFIQTSPAQIIRTKPTPSPQVRQTPPPQIVEPTAKQIGEIAAQIRKRAQPVLVKPIVLPFKRDRLITLNMMPDADLRTEIASFGIPVRDQGARNTCSVFAVTFLHEYMWSKYYQLMGKNIINLDFSEEYLNFVSNYVLGEWADGGFFDELNTGYQKGGFIGEIYVPYQQTFIPYSSSMETKIPIASNNLKQGRFWQNFLKAWNVNTGLSPQQLADLTALLKKGVPVAAGLRWAKPGKFAIEEVSGIPLMKMVGANDVYDGHSIVFVGYKQSKAFPGGGYLIFRNSWGTGFGEQGYGYMSFEYASAYTNDLLAYPMICNITCFSLGD
jgi:hypothetical protein